MSQTNQQSATGSSVAPGSVPGNVPAGSTPPPGPVFATAAPHVDRIAIKLPPFWPEKPEIWIFQVEAQFQISKITSEDTKFNYLVAQLERRYVEHLWDIIQDQSITDKYTKAKNRLLANFRESDSKQMHELLTGLELGDQKPSHLLRKMKNLAGNELTDKALRTLFLEKLPEHIKNVIVISDEPLVKLAEMADKIAETAPQSQVSAVKGAPTPITLESLSQCIVDLQSQIAALSMRPRSHSPYRNRSRSRGRNQFDSKEGFCYYHSRFGSSSKKCNQPCSWSQSGNLKSQ